MCYAVLGVVSNCCPPLKGRFLTRYSPVRHCPLLQLDESSFRRFSFDLHVLSTPPAFVLSQDQTLYKSYLNGHSRLNLYRAICHSFKNFLYLPSRVIDLTPFRQVSQLHILQCAPVWCFSFRSLFNLQGTRPITAEQSLFYHMPTILSTTNFTFCDFFVFRMVGIMCCRSSTAMIDYHTKCPLSTLFGSFFHLS